MNTLSDQSGESAEDLKKVGRFAYGAALALTGVFIVAVSVYATYGGPAVDRLAEENADVLVRKARIAVRAGNEDEAVNLYDRTIAASFKTRLHKMWVLEEYGRYLIDLEREEAAVPVLLEAVHLDPERLPAYDLLVRALVRTSNFDNALSAVDFWIANMREADSPAGLERALTVKEDLLKRTERSAPANQG